MNEVQLQFALPRAVAAVIDVERVPKIARDSGVSDLRFGYSLVGHAVLVTCSREVASTLLENLRRRISSSVVPRDYLPEYKDAVDRIQQALDIDAGHQSDR